MPLSLGIIASSGSGARYEFCTNLWDPANLSSYTFTAASIGTPSSDRYIVVAVSTSDNGNSPATVSSVTVGGQATTVVTQVAVISSDAPRTTLLITNAPVTSGSTADIVVNLSSVEDRCGIAVWSLYGIGSTTPSATATDVGTTLSSSLTAPVGSVIIVASTCLTGSSSAVATASGYTQDFDSSNGLNGFSGGAIKTTASSTTVGTVWSTTNSKDTQVAAAWSP